MFSQKTTELLRRIRRYKSINYKVLVVNYISDNRYGTECIASHDKEYEKAICVENLKSIDTLVKSSEFNVVVIDEGQFFTDLYEYVTQWADTLSVHIVIAGLDGTSERNPFGDILRLIPHAEEVERLNSFCSVCCNGTIANYSKYCGTTVKDDSDVVIGGMELYKPVCRKHLLDSS
jgi:thymidine kinase